MENADEIIVIGNSLWLSECELLYSFDTFDPNGWTLVKHTPKWTVGPGKGTLCWRSMRGSFRRRWALK